MKIMPKLVVVLISFATTQATRVKQQTEGLFGQSNPNSGPKIDSFQDYNPNMVYTGPNHFSGAVHNSNWVRDQY